MDFKQELLTRLDALAAKLGTTGAYLWSVLVRQAYLQGVVDLIEAIICFVVCVVCVYFFKKFLPKTMETSFNDGFYFLSVMVAAITFCFSLLLGISLLSDSIMELNNPAYYALHEVLQTLGK